MDAWMHGNDNCSLVDVDFVIAAIPRLNCKYPVRELRSLPPLYE
jgi:hypothetical protein